MNKLRRVWAFAGSAFVGIFYRFTFEEPIDWSKTYIICANHTSNLDVSAFSLLVKGDYCFIGKEELKEGIVTGLYMKKVDIAVKRDNLVSALKAMKQSAKKLQSGINVVIFPEGKIGEEYPPILHEFKNGPFNIAIDLKIPIIPVSTSNTWKILWDDGLKYGSRPGICDFYVHKPIDTSHLTEYDANDLRDEIYRIINQKIYGETIAEEIV